MPIATLTSKGQITLPVDLRERLRLVAGDRVSFDEQSDGSYLLRPLKGDIRQLKGVVPKPARPVTGEAMDRVIRDGTPSP
jgi:AbrB family looped-hinge helix DNA binding protein